MPYYSSSQPQNLYGIGTPEEDVSSFGRRPGYGQPLEGYFGGGGDPGDSRGFPVPGAPQDPNQPSPYDPGGVALPAPQGNPYGPDALALPAPYDPRQGRPDGSVPPAAPQQQPDPFRQQVQGALSKLLQRGFEAPTTNDPLISGQIGAFRSAQQRGLERSRAALAERAAARGTLPAGGFDAAVGGLEADRGFNEAQYESGLLAQEGQTRRQELLQAMQLAQVMGDNEAQRQLQERLATLDLSLRERLGLGDLGLRERGLGIQERLGQGDIDIRGRALTQQGLLGRGDLALRLLQSLLGNQQFYAGLGENRDQFYANLGLNAAQLQGMLNQNALSQLFRGF